MSITRRVMWIRFIALVVAALFVVAPTRADEWKLDQEHWYVIEIQGHWAGYRVDRTYRDGERIRTTQEQLLTMRRGPETTTLQASTEWIESNVGAPEKVTALQRFGESPMVTEWAFKGERVAEVIRQSDRERSREIDVPERPWLTPTEADRFLAERMAAAAPEIEFVVLGLDAGLPKVTVTYKRAGASVQIVNGKAMTCSGWKINRSDSPRIEVTHHLSEDHRLVKAEEPFGPVEAVIRLASRDEALGHERSDDALPPELLVELFVKPDRPIEDLRRANFVSCRITSADGSPIQLADSGAQRAKKDDAGLFVSVERGRASESTEAERLDESYLKASSLIDSDDPEIRSFATRTLAGVEEPKRGAEALRLGVYRHIQEKTLRSAFASASETVRARVGDCTEHALLLTASLRASGIPSRIALGLIYAEQFGEYEDIFGWHMWSQALIDGQWVDLDATMRGSFHPGHVLFATSSLSGDQLGPEFLDAFMLMGSLKIEVQEVRYAEEKPD